MGAWIETHNLYCARSESIVAPFMGAWIETGSVVTFKGIA